MPNMGTAVQIGAVIVLGLALFAAIMAARDWFDGRWP